MGQAITVDFKIDVFDDTQKYHITRYFIARGFVLPGDYVLDLGCGSGYGTEILSGVAKFVTGIDINKEDIAGAIEHHQKDNNEFICNSLETMEIPECDVAVCLEVMEHLYDWEKFLNKLKARVKKYIIFSVPLDEELVWDSEKKECNARTDHDHKSVFPHDTTNKHRFKDENWREFINYKDGVTYFSVLYNINYFDRNRNETTFNPR